MQLHTQDHDAGVVGHVERGTHSWVFVGCVIGEKLEPRSSIDLAATSLQAAHVL